MSRLKTVNWHWLAALALGFAVFMTALDRTPVPTVDGAVRASMARNIVRTGQLWPITYVDKVFTDHPPLFLWLTAAAYKIFGINDFAANVVPRLAAFLTVAVTALIALEAGLGTAVALGSALVLCSTRDFVLSSVRGYLEPLLELFIYLGLYYIIRQKRSRYTWPAAFAGISVWLAAYTKGPVALWPFLLYVFLLVWNGQTAQRRLKQTATYLGAFAACTLAWAFWVSSRGDWPLWHRYLFGQVLSSALDGRGGAQSLEPLYFAGILTKYYWPWVPLFVWAVARTVRKTLSLELSPHTSYSWVFGVLSLGFIGAFSMMKWKFWYYIAPAYPAMALLIASSFYEHYARTLTRDGWARGIFFLAIGWTVFASVVPVHLHRERVPEVMAFRSTITGSPVTGPVWFVENPRDHNMIGTSGEWYFDRPVTKVTDEVAIDRDGDPTGVSTKQWLSGKLSSPAWILTGTEFFSSCELAWCRRSTLIQTSGASALVYYK